MDLLTPDVISFLLSVIEDGEEFVNIPWANRYWVSNHGRLISDSGNGGQYPPMIRKLKTHSKLSYHKSAIIRHDGAPHTYSISRLVGEMFLSEWYPGCHVCHTDEHLPEHLVNRVDNLWIGNNRDNQLDWNDKNPGLREVISGIKKPREIAVNSMTWELTFNNGNVLVVTNLRKWCMDNNYSPTRLNKLYKHNKGRHKDIIKVVKCG